MSIWTSLLDAAALGIRAKAEQTAIEQSSKRAAKQAPCTPCAANAKTVAHFAAAQHVVKQQRTGGGARR